MSKPVIHYGKKPTKFWMTVFGIIFSIMTIATGDESAVEIASTHPMKFAAMEGLYFGTENATLVIVGKIKNGDDPAKPHLKDFARYVEIPSLLSYWAFLDKDAFVYGIHDHIHGNPERGIISYYAKKINQEEMDNESHVY